MNYHIELTLNKTDLDRNYKYCKLTLSDFVETTSYVDRDEINELRGEGKPNPQFTRLMHIEKPTRMSP